MTSFSEMNKNQETDGCTNCTKIRIEAEKWHKAVDDCKTTLRWLEQRGDAKTKRIRELETKIIEMGGKR